MKKFIENIKKLKLIKLPTNEETGKEMKEFESMLGHTYNAYLSECTNEYVVLFGETEEAEKGFEDTIYKTLVSSGESEEFAKACAYEGEDSGMCLYFKKDCFEEM